jgi:hypothetical protein
LGIAGKDLQADLEGRFVGYEINNLSEGIVGDGSDLFDRVDGVGILCASSNGCLSDHIPSWYLT